MSDIPELTESQLEEMADEQESDAEGFVYLFSSEMIDEGKYQRKTHYIVLNEIVYTFWESQTGSYYTEQHYGYGGLRFCYLAELLSEFIISKGLLKAFVRHSIANKGRDFLSTVVDDINKLKES